MSGNQSDNENKKPAGNVLRNAGKIVITGATGLVGSHLTAELVRNGCRKLTLPVRSMRSLPKLYDTLNREGVAIDDVELETVETSLMNPVMLKRVFKGADMVFHCAAAVAIGGMDDKTLIDINAGITSHVVNAALECGIGKLIYVSSIATITASHEEGRCADELSVMDNFTGKSGYTVSKLLAEYEVKRGRIQGLKTIVVNPATILGAGDYKSGSSAVVPLLSRGLPFYTEGVTAFVDVKDVAKALVMLSVSEKAVGGEFILSAGNFSYRELMDTASRISGKRPPRYRLGRKVLSAASGTDKMIASITRRRQLMTKEMADILLRKYYYAGDKIKKTINFDYTSLEDTLRRLIMQYKRDIGDTK